MRYLLGILIIFINTVIIHYFELALPEYAVLFAFLSGGITFSIFDEITKIGGEENEK